MVKKVKISENRYNGHYSGGSVFENSININMNNDMFQNDVTKVTNDSILSAKFRRSFMDQNLNFVTIEIPAPRIDNVDTFISIIKEICTSEYEIKKDRNFNLQDYVNKLTITIDDSDIEYELAKDSELGKIVMELSGLDIMVKKSNREIIDSINI